ncbi:MAG: hypothetical protein OES47_12240 [Acidobacteriota bacterium]|nr:hypothetical protein [Acidobacteriota bacterium]
MPNKMTRGILKAAVGIVTLALGLSAAASAQMLTLDPVACLPREANAVFRATARPEVSGSDSVRLYFRRLHRTGGYYWTELNASGGGAYWGVFPKPENREQKDLDDKWWELLQDRDWMQIDNRNRDWLDDWMESQEWEGAEYYAAIVAHNGTEKARTKTHLVEVRDRDQCVVGLDRSQVGHTQNLTVGETSPTQLGREVFHWLCEGIVTRVDSENILRPDEFCRACIVAGWMPVATGAGALVAGTTIDKREPQTVSGTQPK